MSELTEISWMSLMPSIVTITLAFLTRQVIVSLFLGVCTGSIVLFLGTHNPSDLNVINTFLLPSIGTYSYAGLLLVYLWCLGGILGIWQKTGSAEYFAENMGKRFAKSRKSCLTFTWLLGMVFHQGGFVSSILTGTTVKPIADHYKVSHEELSYVVDSTASPVATIIPFNAWPMYISGLVAGTIPIISTPIDAYKFYLESIPFNFYSIIAVLFTLLFALNWLPWIGKSMRQARERALTTGKLDSPTARPLLNDHDVPVTMPEGYKPSLVEFVAPIMILLIVTIVPFVAWKLGVLHENNANWTHEAFLIAVFAAVAIAKYKGMNFNAIMDGFMSGCKDMTIGAMIFALALSLGYVSKQLHTADFLIQLLSKNITATMLPICLLVLCMISAFSTGSAFGTYAVVYPVALPLAYAVHPDPTFIKICFGAVLGGTVFGDQCSPISDTTIFSSMFTGCDLMDHVKTQLPLALTAAGLGAILATLIIFVMGF